MVEETLQEMGRTMTRNNIGHALQALLVAYAAASLLHYGHNAEHLAAYPGMPLWLSAWHVYAAWLGVTSIGLIGYALLRSGYQAAGIVALGLYAVLGFDGLGHYAVAPPSVHSLTMNATIWTEVVTALLLLAGVARATRAMWRTR
jgi:hypothetical protein